MDKKHENKAFFGIVMPVYNTGSFLRLTVNSILCQSFSDFELLLINDGSTDGSGNICDEFALADTRVRVLHRQNSGVVASTNIGLEQVCAEYAYFVDHDDILAENALQTMHDAITSQPEPPDVLVCNFQYLKDGTVSSSGIVLPKGPVPTNLAQRRDYFYDKLFFAPLSMVLALWTKAMRVDFLRSSNISGDTRYISAVDGDITIKLINSTSRFIFCDVPVYQWRVDERQTLSRTSSPKVVKARLQWFRHVFYLSFQKGLSKKTRLKMRTFALSEEKLQLDQMKSSAMPHFFWHKLSYTFRRPFGPMPWYFTSGWYWRIVYPLGAVFGHKRVQGFFASFRNTPPPESPNSNQ